MWFESKDIVTRTISEFRAENDSVSAWNFCLSRYLWNRSCCGHPEWDLMPG